VVGGAGLGEDITDTRGYYIETDVQGVGNVAVALASGEERSTSISRWDKSLE
jgi:hypothetical protein